jgi:hypothetical protein
MTIVPTQQESLREVLTRKIGGYDVHSELWQRYVMLVY